MQQNLENIREQLFDAPADVKEAYNDVVEYFGIMSTLKAGLAGAKAVGKEIAAKGKKAYYQEKIKDTKAKIEELQAKLKAYEEKLKSAE